MEEEYISKKKHTMIRFLLETLSYTAKDKSYPVEKEEGQAG
jgi:hypothetical protein